MIDWYFLAISTLVFFGLQHFLFKMSAEKKCNTAWTTTSFMATTSLLSIIAIIITRPEIENIIGLSLIAFFNSITFLLGVLANVEGLKHIPASVFYPIRRMGVAIVVLIGVFFLKETLTFFQIIGVLLVILVFFLLTKNEDEKVKDKNFNLGILLAISVIMLYSINSVIIKFAAAEYNLLAFMAISYVLSTMFSLTIRKKMQTKNTKNNHKTAIIIGFFVGLLNFAGFFILMKALSVGPLSIVLPLNSMSFIVTIILSVIFYKEKITLRRISGVVLSILAIILLGL